MTYNELYKNSIDRLTAAGINDAESDVRLLFYYLLGIDRGALFMKAADEADDESVSKICDAVKIRQSRIPLQHITGVQEFMGLEFTVNSDVLIPRFDTECLVEEAMLVCSDGDKVLDVCTGSGCILISLMKYKNNIDGVGCDISEKALEVAKANARKLLTCSEGPKDWLTCEASSVGGSQLGGADGLELCKPTEVNAYDSKLCKARFVLSDLYVGIPDSDFDIIVSNPPYIRTDVIDTLEPEVKHHDPMLALDGGADGLEFYRRIISEAPAHLKKGGRLLVEIGYDQGESVKGLFCESGFKDVEVVKDLAGNKRVVRGKI